MHFIGRTCLELSEPVAKTFLDKKWYALLRRKYARDRCTISLSDGCSHYQEGTVGDNLKIIHISHIITPLIMGVASNRQEEAIASASSWNLPYKKRPG